MNNLYDQKVAYTNTLFDNRFLNNKVMYLFHFNAIPDLYYIGFIDGEKAFEAFKEKFASLIVKVYQYRWYKQKDKAYNFDKTIIMMSNNCVVEFDDDYCEILHDNTQQEFIHALTEMTHDFKERDKKEPCEINIITNSGGSLGLRTMEVNPAELDIDLFYEDDFKPIDETIQKRLNNSNDKGIVLLHGLPGTGKTSYLRYLIGKLNKRMLFLSPNVAGDLANPEFMDLLINNPNTILIIEDAESIIMDRKFNANSSVSNLLNISDGLLADFLNVQLICTFNSALTMIDSALLRKGRLIAKYEFGKLGINKAQKLSDHLGHNKIINEPMTLAEISNPQEQSIVTSSKQPLGFRREPVLTV
jgi:hypothetical protein